MPATRNLEEEVVDLRRRIASEEATEARLRSDADQVLAQVQDDVEQRGLDRWSPEIIERVDSAYREPDGKRDEIAVLRNHLTNLLQRAGQADAPDRRFGPGAEGRAQRGDPIARAYLESDAYRRTVELARGGSPIGNAPEVEVLDREATVALMRRRG